MLLKQLHEKYPFTFGMVVLILYFGLDIADARWFIPHMANKCKGALTEEQEERCFHWYYIKEKVDGQHPH